MGSNSKAPACKHQPCCWRAVCTRDQQSRRRSKSEGLSHQEDSDSPALWVTMTSLLIFLLQERWRSQGLRREEKGTEQGDPLELQEEKPGVALAVLQESLQLQSESGCGVLGQVGHRVFLRGADANGNRRRSFQPMRHHFPNEFCIPLMRTHGLA